MLEQGGPRLQLSRATLWFEEKLAGCKERNSIATERLVCCSNRHNFFCTPSTIFYSRAIFKFSVCLPLKKALSQITNMEHIFSAKSLKRGNCPVCPPPPFGCRPGYPSIISNCFPRISMVFPIYFVMFSAVFPLEIKTLLE